MVNQKYDNGIPPELWGKDHFTAFLYAESRATDNNGEMDRRNLRGYCPGYSIMEGVKVYPTRLNDGTEVEDYCDLECLNDFEDHGYLVHTGYPSLLVTITDKGQKLASHLRQQKQQGKPYTLPEE